MQICRIISVIFLLACFSIYGTHAYAADQTSTATPFATTPRVTPSTAPDASSTITPTTMTPAVAVPSTTTPVSPTVNDSFYDALKAGTFFGELRYRYEDVHQDNLAHQATANTLRTIVGYDSGDFMHMKAQLAALDVMHLSNDIYNDGSNGRTAYPSIGDPEDLQLYLANLTYDGLPDTTMIAGRQKLSLDNERWVGAANWRQIGQTYDGVTVKNKSFDDLSLLYSFMFHEQRSPGTGVTNGTYDMHTHLFHASYSGVKDVRFIGYSYLVDLRNLGGSLSSATTGGRIEASHSVADDVTLTGNGEYARQVSYADNPTDFGLNYYALEPGLVVHGITTRFVYEYMGANGVVAVQSPLKSAHSANGWADQFATIPATGLTDAYINIAYSFKLPFDDVGDTRLGAQWHDYNAVQVSQHYGNEYDIDFVQNFGKHYAVGLQLADYIADHFSTDTKKVALTAQIKY